MSETRPVRKSVHLSVGGFHFVRLDTSADKNRRAVTWPDTAKDMEKTFPIADVAYFFARVNDLYYFAASNKSNASLIARQLRIMKMEPGVPEDSSELPLVDWQLCFGPVIRLWNFTPYEKGYFIDRFGIAMYDLDIDENFILGDLKTWSEDNFLKTNLGEIPSVFYGTTLYAAFIMAPKEHGKAVFNSLIRKKFYPSKPADYPNVKLYSLHLGKE